MNSHSPLLKYGACTAAAVACAAAVAMLPPPQSMADLRGAQPRAAHLDCARISARWVREPDLVTVCSMLADVGPGRDAGVQPGSESPRPRKATGEAGAIESRSRPREQERP